MQIKRFEAPTMTEALRLVKEEFGSKAVILSARSLKKQKGVFASLKKPIVEVTAASDIIVVDKNDKKEKEPKTDETKSVTYDFSNLARKKSVMDSLLAKARSPLQIQKSKNFYEKNIHSFQDDADKSFGLRKQLLSQGVDEDIVSKIIEKLDKVMTSQELLKSDQLKPNLINIFKKMGARAYPIKLGHGKQTIAAFVGPAGVGKTTLIARLAAVHAIRSNKKIAIITMDNHRIAALEQIKIYTKIIGVPWQAALSKQQLRCALFKFRDKDLVLIDTSGVGKRNKKLFAELEDLLAQINNVEIHLLLSASMKSDDIVDLLEIFKSISIDRLAFTKLDESSSFGNILNQLIWTKIPASYFTVGQQVPDDFEIASITKLVDLIITEKQKKAFLPALQKALQNDENEKSASEPALESTSKPAPELVSEPISEPKPISKPALKPMPSPKPVSKPPAPKPTKSLPKPAQSQSNEPKALYVANKNSDIFHRPNCKWAKKIKKKNMITFASKIEAENSRLKPCKLCIFSKEKHRNNANKKTIK